MSTYKLGKELQVGDTIEVWWADHRDTIRDLSQYTGRLAKLFPEGAQIAQFALCRSGMTIDNGEYYRLI